MPAEGLSTFDDLHKAEKKNLWREMGSEWMTSDRPGNRGSHIGQGLGSRHNMIHPASPARAAM